MSPQMCLVDDAIFAFASGAMAPPEAAEAERHLARCETCCALVAESVKWLNEPDPNAFTRSDRATERQPKPSAASPVILSGGMSVGRYEIVDVLGRGGMGVVYRARDPELHRNLAVKLLRSDFSAERGLEEAKARLLREARAMARVSDPHVVTIYDVGVWQDQIFIAMELIEGPTLRRWLKRRPPWRDVLDTFLDAGLGLVAAHETGLVHRDFKPENVLMGKGGRAMVTDFGLARPAMLVEARSGLTRAATSEINVSFLTLTETGGLTGTPAYMAPEQFAGSPPDVRTDVFSFGVALYEGLYGERPFGAEAGNLLVSHVRAGRILPAPEGSSVPSEVRGVLSKALSVDPDERFPSMRALLAELEEAARCASSPMPKAATVDARKRAKPARWIVGFSVVATITGVALASMVAGGRCSPPVAAPEELSVEAARSFSEPGTVVGPPSAPALVTSETPSASVSSPSTATRAPSSPSAHPAARSRNPADRPPRRRNQPKGVTKLGDDLANPF